MKKKILFILLAQALFFTSCQQKEIDPNIQTEETSPNESVETTKAKSESSGFLISYEDQSFQVSFEKVFTKSASNQIVADYANQTGKLIETPVGTHWQAIEIKVSNESDLIPNYSLANPDGSEFSFNSISYPRNIYQVSIDEKEYLLFLIPNGCKEYAIKVQNDTLITIQSNES